MMEEKYAYALSKEEMMYLAIHIQTNVDKSRAAAKKASAVKEELSVDEADPQNI